MNEYICLGVVSGGDKAVTVLDIKPFDGSRDFEGNEIDFSQPILFMRFEQLFRKVSEMCLLTLHGPREDWVFSRTLGIVTLKLEFP